MAPTPNPTLTLRSKHPVGGNVWSFVFEPSQPLTWTAGQFIRIELPHPHPDEEGTRRYFTIASAPHQGVVQISTRLTQSTFKQALAGLPIGGHLDLLDPPAGRFIWQNAAHPHTFVAQGIGITPFYSMLHDRLHHEEPLDAHLIYANLTPDIPFEAEIVHWSRTYPELKLTFTRQPVTAPILTELARDLGASIVYVSGPRSLVQLLAPPYNLPATHLKQDFFPNYPQHAY